MKRYIVLIGLLLLIVGCQLGGSKESPPASPIQGATVAKTPTPSSTITLEDVQILGKYGFNPAEVRISAGDIVVWKNEDTQKKAVVLTFHQEGTRTFIAGDQIPYGDTYTFNFEEPGRYEYWTVGYGVKGSVIVE